LLEQIADPIASFTGDGAYDRDDVYRGLPASSRCGGHSAATFGRSAKRNGRQRADEARPAPAADRRAWSHGLAAASGYNWRALVEADIGRYKRVIGDALRSRTGGRQMTEVAIAVASLNRMLELGRPEYVRLT
jgi:hypothetical protein